MVVLNIKQDHIQITAAWSPGRCWKSKCRSTPCNSKLLDNRWSNSKNCITNGGGGYLEPPVISFEDAQGNPVIGPEQSLKLVQV